MSVEPLDALARVLHDTLRRTEDEREPLADEMLEAYVDGRLGDVDRELVEARLEDDPSVRDEVDDLHALRAALAVSVDTGLRVTATAVPAASRRAPTVPFDTRLILAALAALVVLVVAWLAWRAGQG